MYINQFHGTYFNITLIFILTSLWWVKFYGHPKTIFVSGHNTQKSFMFSSTIFLSPSCRFQEHTNPTILMDAKQLELTLALLLLFEPFVLQLPSDKLS